MHFQRAAFVRRADNARFTRILSRSRALLQNHFVEVVIVLLVLGVSLRLLSPAMAAKSGAWQLQSVAENPRLSSNAQWWLALVSQPLFLIFVARWCWRSLVWFRTLRCIARLDLNLVPAHPDRAGGLLFVAQSIPALAPFGFALACALAGAIAGSTSAQPFDTDDAARGRWARCSASCWSSRSAHCAGSRSPLRASQLRGIVEYGELASRIGRRFEARWLRERRFVTSDALSAIGLLGDDRSLLGRERACTPCASSRVKARSTVQARRARRSFPSCPCCSRSCRPRTSCTSRRSCCSSTRSRRPLTDRAPIATSRCVTSESLGTRSNDSGRSLFGIVLRGSRAGFSHARFLPHRERDPEP